MHYYECGLHICFLKILKHGALRKSEATQVFQNQRRKSLFRQKNFYDVKDSMDQKEIMI